MTSRSGPERIFSPLDEWFLKRLDPCTKVVPLISRSLDGPLSYREWISLRLHLLFCDWCVKYLRQMHIMRLSLQPPSRSSSPTLAAGARQRIIDACRRL